MINDSKWPLSEKEQDTVVIYTMKRMLERTLGAREDYTVVMYTPALEKHEGGSVEFSFLCDYLHESELNNIMDLANSTMQDGDPRVTVSIHFIFDPATREKLLKEFEDEKIEHPDSKFLEFFVVDIEYTYTKNDWEKMVGSPPSRTSG